MLLRSVPSIIDTNNQAQKSVNRNMARGCRIVLPKGSCARMFFVYLSFRKVVLLVAACKHQLHQRVHDCYPPDKKCSSFPHPFVRSFVALDRDTTTVLLLSTPSISIITQPTDSLHTPYCTHHREPRPIHRLRVTTASRQQHNNLYR